MATVHGKDGSLSIDSNVIAVASTWTLEITNEVAEQSVIGSDWRDYLAGQSGWTVELEGWYDTADSAYAALVAGATVTVDLGPSGSGSGDTTYAGSAIVGSISNVNARDSVVSFTASLQGVRELAETVNP